MSKIQWTDKTANPIKRLGGGNYCELTSPGCANCYASLLNSRGTRFGGNGLAFGGSNQERPEMVLNVEMLKSWARMRKPHKIFVGSMTDVFGEWIPDWIIFSLFDAMAAAPRQIFQILTKRPERACNAIADWLYDVGLDQLPPNIWLGISAEDQQRFDERMPWLAKTPAAVRFLSLEPLLGPITLPDSDGVVNMAMQEGDNPIFTAEPIDYIDWVIIGGESGPSVRPMNLDWVEDILTQCLKANIPAFVKQLGAAWAGANDATHSKGGDPDEWPEEFQVRMFPGDWR
jgi:protein gp37